MEPQKTVYSATLLAPKSFSVATSFTVTGIRSCEYFRQRYTSSSGFVFHGRSYLHFLILLDTF